MYIIQKKISCLLVLVLEKQHEPLAIFGVLNRHRKPKPNKVQ